MSNIITVEKITKNNFRFIFSNSNHTFGNMIQKELLNSPDVTFAGYTVPHTLESKMIIQVITINKNPKDVIINCIDNLIHKMDSIHSIFNNSSSSS
jgi:DNA-directed RNA polymerase subunit L